MLCKIYDMYLISGLYVYNNDGCVRCVATWSEHSCLKVIFNEWLCKNAEIVALRYAASDGQWKESAIRLTNSIVNIRAIVNHFNPKVESWMTAHNLSSLTEEQVYIHSTFKWLC